jgi:hypothetical protein
MCIMMDIYIYIYICHESWLSGLLHAAQACNTACLLAVVHDDTSILMAMPAERWPPAYGSPLYSTLISNAGSSSVLS